MLRLAFDFIITWRETRTRPNAYDISLPSVSFTIDSLSLEFAQIMPADKLSRLLIIKFQASVCFMEPYCRFSSPIGSAWQAIVVSPVLYGIVFTYMIFLHFSTG